MGEPISLSSDLSSDSSFDFPVKIIQEGTTRLAIPDLDAYVNGKHGLAALNAPIFYNPVMTFNRDVSVLFTACERPKTVLDGLAGTGVRGVRIANEVGASHVTINDASAVAYAAIRYNINLNDCKNAHAENKDVNALMLEKKFDYIDLDPFGSPVPFIENALKSIKNQGVLAITATDTMNLCGVYPKACLRKYGAQPLKTPYVHDVALRILIGHVVREGTKYSLGCAPLFVHSSDHYLRVYLKTDKSASDADASLKNNGYILHCKTCGRRQFSTEKERCCSCGAPFSYAGPLWTGKLFDSQYVAKMREKREALSLATEKRIDKLLAVAAEEAAVNELMYTTGEIARKAKASPPLDAIIASLHELGFSASRTHCDPTAFRTDASIEDVRTIFESLKSESVTRQLHR